MGTKKLCVCTFLPCILAMHACALPASTRQPDDGSGEGLVAETDALAPTAMAAAAPTPELPAATPSATDAPTPSEAPPPTDVEPDASTESAAAVVPAVAPTSDVGECYSLQAHEVEVAGDATPHVVEVGEHYSCFYFDVPWPQGAQAASLRTHAGPMAHHLELFHLEAAEPAGTVLRMQPNCGFMPRVPLAIWGIGQQSEQLMPEGVGLELPAPSATQRLYLEVHYVNPDVPAPDATGLEICTTRSPRPQAAGIFDLGPGPFSLPPGQASTVTATCTPAHAGDIHVFRAFPHMHARGRSFEAEVARADGSLESILDVDYDFSAQRTYDLDVVLHGGDRLLSHCNFVNDTNRLITDGFTGDDEMCDDFVYAWPAGSLTNGPLGVPGGCFY